MVELPTIRRIRAALRELDETIEDTIISRARDLVIRQRRVLEWALEWHWKEICHDSFRGVDATSEVDVWVAADACCQYQLVAMLCGQDESTKPDELNAGIAWAQADEQALRDAGEWEGE